MITIHVDPTQDQRPPLPVPKAPRPGSAPARASTSRACFAYAPPRVMTTLRHGRRRAVEAEVDIWRTAGRALCHAANLTSARTRPLTEECFSAVLRSRTVIRSPPLGDMVIATRGSMRVPLGISR